MAGKKEVTVREDGKLFQCPRCGCVYSRYKGYFPVSHAELYRGTGYIPICEACIDELYGFYRKKYGDERKAIRRICMMLDLYWGESVYKMINNAAGGATTRIRTYISKTNLASYVSKTFDNTLAEEEEARKAAAEAKGETLVEEVKQPEYVDKTVRKQSNLQERLDELNGKKKMVDPGVVDFWGPGFDFDTYAFLQKRYEHWTGSLDKTSLDPSETVVYQQICLAELSANRNVANGKSTKEDVASLLNLLGSANLKPAQKKEELSSDIENMPLGVGIQKWETKRPLPETDESLKDKNHFVKYITVWFFGHLSKMLGLKNSYCKLYNEEIDRLKVERPELSDDEDLLLYDSVKEK